MPLFLATLSFFLIQGHVHTHTDTIVGSDICGRGEFRITPVSMHLLTLPCLIDFTIHKVLICGALCSWTRIPTTDSLSRQEGRQENLTDLGFRRDVHSLSYARARSVKENRANLSKLAKHVMEPEKPSSCYIQICWNDAVVLYKLLGFLHVLLDKFQSSPWMHIVL